MKAQPARGRTKILEAVAELARTELDWQGAIEPGMRLVEDLGLDSIRLLTLAMAVEDHFRICLDEDDEAAILTLEDLVSVIERKLSAAAGPDLATTALGGADA